MASAEETRQLSLVEITNEFNKLSPSEDETYQKEVGRLAQQALSHEKDDVDGVVKFLTHAVDNADGDTVAALLNNLGCVEKRRGRFKEALHHLEQAADVEGGLEAASPSTLINMSATYSALVMFAEAASVANHAVMRCSTDFHKARPLVKAAAYHNLATALEGSGELTFAAEAYEKAMKILNDNGQGSSTQHRVIERASEQVALKLNNSRAHTEQEEWERHVRPHILKQSQAALRRNGELPPLKVKPPTTASTALTNVGSPSRVGRLKGRASGDMSTVYTGSLKKYHALRAITGPHNHTPAKERTLLPAAVSLPPRSDPALWNSDPVAKEHSLSHRVTAIPKNWDIEQHVDETFMPRALVPLVEDIKYKESTRRRAIMREWSKRMQVLRHAHRRQQVSSEEDEFRVSIEIEEVRVYRVLQQYIRGKVFFAEGSVQLDAEESETREERREEAHEAWRALLPHSQQLQCLAEEEFTRFNILKEARTEFEAIQVDHDTNAAAVDCDSVVGSAKYSLCCALATWCLEGVFIGPEGKQHIAALEDAAMKKSLHVQERYATFGAHKPKE